MVRVRITYLLGTVAILVALPCLLAALAPGPTSTATWVTLASSGAIATLCSSFEARRDDYALAQFAVVILGIAAAFAVGVYAAAETETSRWRAMMGIGFCGVGFVWAVSRILREQRLQGRSPERAPGAIHAGPDFRSRWRAVGRRSGSDRRRQREFGQQRAADGESLRAAGARRGAGRLVIAGHPPGTRQCVAILAGHPPVWRQVVAIMAGHPPVGGRFVAKAGG